RRPERFPKISGRFAAYAAAATQHAPAVHAHSQRGDPAVAIAAPAHPTPAAAIPRARRAGFVIARSSRDRAPRRRVAPEERVRLEVRDDARGVLDEVP